MGIPYTTERQIQQLPATFLLFVDLGYRELIGDVIPPDVCYQGDPVPKYGSVIKDFH